MKLSTQEREALRLLRLLDVQQRTRLIGDMRRQLEANSITKRVSGLRRLHIVPDRRIEETFGLPLSPRRTRQRRGGPAEAT